MKYLIFLYFFFLCSCSNRDKSIVAEVNGYEISASELSRLTTQETFDLLNTAYEIKLKALDDLIKHKLIEQEAAAVGKTFNVFLDDYGVTRMVIFFLFCLFLQQILILLMRLLIPRYLLNLLQVSLQFPVQQCEDESLLLLSSAHAPERG